MLIAVYGHTGVVGSQLYRWLQQKGVRVGGVSLDGRDGEQGEAEWAFLCLPTLNSAEGVQDQGAIWDVCDGLSARHMRVVLRSTVLPGTCAQLADAYPRLTIYHWPEFLSARTAWRDFCAPRLHVAGTDGNWAAVGAWREQIEPLLPEAVAGAVYVSWATSEMVKYAHNVHGAMQVIYANQVYDACRMAGANWSDVRDALPLLGYVSQRQADAYWDVWKDDKRGYGGECFPKDVRALLVWLSELGVGAELLDGMESANARLRWAVQS